jgi:hypothetical protein
MSAPTCTVIKSVCEALPSNLPYGDAYCDDAMKFCASMDQKGGMMSDTEAKFCMNFSVSEPTCLLAEQVCSLPGMEGNSFCKRLQGQCAWK